METIFSYYTPKWQHTSRQPPEKFADMLKNFYTKYTNTKLEKMKFIYNPKRLSDPDDYKHHQELENWSDSWKPAPMETDEEIDRIFEYIQKLDIISEKHRQKSSKIYEEHEYEINISSYEKLIALIKQKSGTSSSSYGITIENEFDFNNYDYSEFKNLFKFYNYRNGANLIWLNIENGVEFGYRPENKCSHLIKVNLYFPKFTDAEKDFLRNIQKELKIKFSSKGFSFYHTTDKGKLKSKKEVLKL